MRKLFFLLCSALMVAIQGHAITVNNTAGQLSQLVQNTNITQLTVTGTMDARDFLFITQELNELTSVNLSQATILSYHNERALYGTLTSYQANEIPRTAFFGKKLTSVTLPSTLQAIGFAAFAGCDLLRSVTLPESVTYIAEYAFAGTGLTSVEVPATVGFLGKGAFARCESLVSATVNASHIDDFAFLGDYRLSQVTIGANVGNISKGLFNGCTALTAIDFDPACRLSRIDDEAFINSGLQDIDINALGLGTLGEWALAQTQLTTIKLSDGMTQMGEGALAHNRQLTDVIFPGMGHDNPGGSGSLRAPHRPHTLSAVSDYAFAGDELLHAGDMLRNGVATIGNYALYNVCNDIDTMRLPGSVVYLGDMAMAGMIGMQTIKTDAVEVPELGNDVWAGVDQPSIPLFAPNGESLELYKAADQWMYFFYQTEPDFLLGDVNGDGNVNIADVTMLINFLLNGGSINMNNADVTRDGNVNISDVTALINLLLNSHAKMSLQNIHSQASIQSTATSDKFVIPSVKLRAGETSTVDVELTNDEHGYTALNCEIVLPEGVELVAVEGLDRGSAHDFYVCRNEVEENVYSIMGLSMDMASFSGTEGNVMRLTLVASDDFDAQGAELTFANISLVTLQSEIYLAADAVAKVNDASGVEQITANKEVAGVRYINVAGQESDKPFSGMNIVVTTYTDGTTSTVKVIK